MVLVLDLLPERPSCRGACDCGGIQAEVLESSLCAYVVNSIRVGGVTSMDTSPGGRLGTDTCSTLLLRSGAKTPPLPTPPPLPCTTEPSQWPTSKGPSGAAYAAQGCSRRPLALQSTEIGMCGARCRLAAYQEMEPNKTSCAHSEVQVVDKGSLGRHSSRIVMPDQRHCQGASERLQAVLMQLACGQIGQIHNLEVPAWPRALHQSDISARPTCDPANRWWCPPRGTEITGVMLRFEKHCRSAQLVCLASRPLSTVLHPVPYLEGQGSCEVDSPKALAEAGGRGQGEAGVRLKAVHAGSAA